MTQLTTPTKDITKTIIDPVCGMNVPFGKIDLVVKYQGCSYYFCAESCRKAFEKNPQKYLETVPNKGKGWWGRYLERLNKATDGKPLKCH
jgi:YHS domain-containing protein